MRAKTRIIRLSGDETEQRRRLDDLLTDGWLLCGVLPASNGDVMAYLQPISVEPEPLYTDPR